MIDFIHIAMQPPDQDYLLDMQDKSQKINLNKLIQKSPKIPLKYHWTSERSNIFQYSSTLNNRLKHREIHP